MKFSTFDRDNDITQAIVQLCIMALGGIGGVILPI